MIPSCRDGRELPVRLEKLFFYKGIFKIKMYILQSAIPNKYIVFKEKKKEKKNFFLEQFTPAFLYYLY